MVKPRGQRRGGENQSQTQRSTDSSASEGGNASGSEVEGGSIAIKCLDDGSTVQVDEIVQDLDTLASTDATG